MPLHPLTSSCPFPTIDEGGTLKDGYLLVQSDYCQRSCTERPCKAYLAEIPRDGVFYRTCPNGYSVALGRHGRLVVAVNGVVELTTSIASPVFKHKEHLKRKLKRPQFEAWFSSVAAASVAYDNAVAEAGRDSIAALHDIKTTIASLLRATETWLWAQPGISIEEKVEFAGPELKTVYQACRVLEALLRMTDVIANPAAAKYGSPSSKSVYKLTHMLSKVFEPRAHARSINIRCGGSSFTLVSMYESFLIIPLALIDNAVKYASMGSEIDITIYDRPGGRVQLTVTSYGPLVPMGQRSAIFSRGVRGTNVTGRGSGLGLFVAQEVAKLHGQQSSINLARIL